MGKALWPLKPNGTKESVIISKTCLRGGGAQGEQHTLGVAVVFRGNAVLLRRPSMVAFTRHGEPGPHLKCTVRSPATPVHIHGTTFLHFCILPEQLPEVPVIGFICTTQSHKLAG